MNKQEAIEMLQDVAQRVFYRTGSRSVHIDKIVELVNQIDEPQKVVVPKCVAEWIEYCKHEKFYALHGAYANMDEEMKCWRFIGNNSAIFAKAWMDGYTVEKEQLYTVRIPNPALDNLEFVIVLKRIRGRVCLVNTYDYMGRELSDEYKLTESEIKKDFEWAWNAGFAKEVE